MVGTRSLERSRVGAQFSCRGVFSVPRRFLRLCTRTCWSPNLRQELYSGLARVGISDAHFRNIFRASLSFTHPVSAAFYVFSADCILDGGVLDVPFGTITHALRKYFTGAFAVHWLVLLAMVPVVTIVHA